MSDFVYRAQKKKTVMKEQRKWEILKIKEG